eukprot:s3016_g4.t1
MTCSKTTYKTSHFFISQADLPRARYYDSMIGLLLARDSSAHRRASALVRPESMGNVMRPTVDARMQAAVAAVTAVQAVNNDAMTASRSGSPAPIVHYQHPVQLPAQAWARTSQAEESEKHGLIELLYSLLCTWQNSAAAPAATRISPAMQGSCQVLAPNLAPAVYQRPPRPAMCIRGVQLQEEQQKCVDLSVSLGEAQQRLAHAEESQGAGSEEALRAGELKARELSERALSAEEPQWMRKGQLALEL